MSYSTRVDLIKDAIEVDDSGRAMYELAMLYVSRGIHSRRHDAARWLTRAIRRDKRNADYRIALASIQWALARATTDPTRAISLATKARDGFTELGPLGQQRTDAITRWLTTKEANQ